MKKLIIAILSCQKNVDKCSAIKETWLKNCPFKAFFLIGRPGKPTEVIDDTIYIDCDDSYMGHTYKMVAFYEFAYQHLDFDYIFKCDDDTYVDVKMLSKLPFDQHHYLGFLRLPYPAIDQGISHSWRKYHYPSVKPHEKTPYTGPVIGPWAFGGAGYFLSKHALKYVLAHDKTLIEGECFEDKMIGDIMFKNGVVAGNTNLLKDHVTKFELFNKKWNNIGPIPFASVHPCSPKGIRLIHKRNNVFFYTAVFLYRCLRKIKHIISNLLWNLKNVPVKFISDCYKTIILNLSVKHLYGDKKINYGTNELIITCIVRNGGLHIRSFIEHHFALGVKHIIFLDNGSTDDTVSIAKSYKNITILETQCPYKKYETLMKKFLVKKFSKKRWNLFVDIDELFDYPFSHKQNLESLLNYLNQNSYTAVVAQLLDLFSDDSLKDLRSSINDNLKEKYIYYDISNIEKIPYIFGKLSNKGIKMHQGGIRKTIFNTNNGLTKAPLVFVNRGIGLFEAWHHTKNSKLADFTCVLYHYPFVNNFYDKVFEAVKTDRYSNTSAGKEYKMYAKKLDTDSQINIKLETATKLGNINDLLNNRFLVVSPQYIKWANG